MRISHVLYIGLAMCAMIGGGGLIWQSTRWPADQIVPTGPDTDTGLVALPDGSTMQAVKGTTKRQLVDWLASGEQSRAFELGGDQFVGRSPEPTPMSVARIKTLVGMMKSYPDVDILIVGHCDCTGDAAADSMLGTARANSVARYLQAGGIGRSRIAVDTRGGSQPVGDDNTPEGRSANQRVSIVLSRRDKA